MRIGLTQRVVLSPTYPERRDALDQRWAPFLAVLGVTPVVLLNTLGDVSAYATEMGLEGVILSGGNDIDAPLGAADAAPERDALERALLDHCRRHTLPVVGVCRGMQMLQRYGGGPLTRVEGHAGTRHRLDWNGDAPAEGRSAEVNSYHGQGIAAATLSAGYRPLAYAPDGTVEAAAHQDLPWLGVMWHPEREAAAVEADLALMRLWLKGKPV